MAKTKIGKDVQRVISHFAAFNTPLDEYIGRTVRYKKATCIAEKEEYKIRHIQTNYKGDLCFNLEAITEDHVGGSWLGSPSHQIGRCASQDAVYFTDVKS